MACFGTVLHFCIDVLILQWEIAAVKEGAVKETLATSTPQIIVADAVEKRKSTRMRPRCARSVMKSYVKRVSKNTDIVVVLSVAMDVKSRAAGYVATVAGHVATVLQRERNGTQLWTFHHPRLHLCHLHRHHGLRRLRRHLSLHRRKKYLKD